MKKILVYIILTLISSGIIIVFWQQELVYNLPTPLPSNYKPVEVGQSLTLPFVKEKSNTALFLHFFNPNCPCSRFNMKHFKNLVNKYGKQVQFVVFIQTQDSSLLAEEIKTKYDLNVPCVIDRDKKIANLCGVYSTPQAVILDSGNKLYFRGNYNKSRYCSDKKSDFAQMALDSLLKKSHEPTFSALATRPYGCSLPSCNK